MRFFQPLLAGATLSGRLLACVGAVIGIALTIIVCGGLPIFGPDLPIIVAPLGPRPCWSSRCPPVRSPSPGRWSAAMSCRRWSEWRCSRPSLAAAGGGVRGRWGDPGHVADTLPASTGRGGGADRRHRQPGIHAAGFSFAFAPVAINSIALVAIGMFFHRATGRSYPHEPALAPPVSDASRIRAEDIDAALEDMHESFDIAREDLDMLLAHAERHARARAAPMRGSAS